MADQLTGADSAGNAPGGDAGTSGEPGVAQEFETPFNINEVPEDVRSHVEKYANQLKSAYSKKTAELAEQRIDSDTQSQLELLARLKGEDGLDALNELADALGYEPAESEGEPEPEAEATDDEQSELEQLREKIAKIEEADQARSNEAAEQQVQDAVLDGIEEYADERGLDELPEPVVKALMLTGLSVPYKDGLPDMSRAVEVYQEAQQAELKLYLDAVKAKSESGVDTSGSSGVEKVDLSDRRTRLDAANRVAARHV